MRLSREAKAQHHESITSAASKMLRKRGIERTSLADLMQAAGMTHGGFYRHFRSKDELVSSSASKTFDDVFKKFESLSAQEGAREALIAYVGEYLSERHRDDPSLGCMVSACGSDAPRQSAEVRDALTNGITRTLKFAAAGLSCSEEKREGRAIELQSMLLGSLIMARATDNAELSGAILEQARQRAFQMIDEHDA